jgi:hypothetical protein
MRVEGRNYLILATVILGAFLGACKSETQDEANKKVAEKAASSSEVKISDIKSSAEEVRTGQTVTLYVDILSNPSGLSLTFEWTTDKGTIEPPSGSTQVTYHAPNTAGNAIVRLTVKNNATGSIITTKSHTLQIIPPPLPQISEIMGGRPQMKVGKSAELYVNVLSNPSNINLAFEWSASRGRIEPSTGSDRVTYHAPEERGSETIRLVVKNSTTDESITTKTLQLQIIPRPPPVDVIANFPFAGWMGAQSITLNDGYTGNPHSPPACVKVTYRPGSQRWAGIYAQYNVRQEGSNWGIRPGRDLTGYTELIFWAKGERGGEMVEFKAGGIDSRRDGPQFKYTDSFEKSLGTVKLGKNWQRYELELADEDLSSVIGGFCWVAKAGLNPNGMTFYIDTITYE